MDILESSLLPFFIPSTSSEEGDASAELTRVIRSLHELRVEDVLDHPHFSALSDPQTTLQQKRQHIEQLLKTALDASNPESFTWMMILGISALLSYVKNNFAGPGNDIDLGKMEDDSIKELGIDGEDFPTKTSSSHLLLLARMTLVEPLQLKILNGESSNEASFALQIGDVTVELEPSKQLDVFGYVSSHMPSWLLWAGRTNFIHQKFLKHSSASLRSDSIAISDVVKEQLADNECWSIPIRARVWLELAHWEMQYRRIQLVNAYINKMESLLGISVELSGAMGKRTMHQVDPKAQLIVKIQRGGEEGAPLASDDVEPVSIQYTSGLSEDDILMHPKWCGHVSFEKLDVMEQCLMLAKCDIIEVGTTNDELKLWEMEPFVQLVQSQPHSTFLIQAKAKLMRIQHERGRGRTKERALEMMDQLVNDIQHRSIGNRDRVDDVFALRIPGILHLRKQLAEQQIAFGDVASAMKTYEELELWDELVVCYRLLEKKVLADVIVCRQLDAHPQSPRLLCTLGDLRSDPNFYIQAWGASDQRYPRAQRSLARHALGKSDYVSAVQSYDLALALNTLHPDAWFALGYCHLKLEDDMNALKAFTRCAQLEPENGEAWNNLGALWLRKKKPDRALWALKEAIKYKRTSWETWENYTTVPFTFSLSINCAFQAGQACGEYSLAIQGMIKVLELTDGRQLKSELLTSLIKGTLRKIEQTPTDEHSFTQRLPQQMENMLRQACLLPTWKAEHWLLFAKVQKHLNQPLLVQDCLMKGFRQLYGSGWKTDVASFRLLIEALSGLVYHYRTMTVTRSDIHSLCLQLKGIAKQADAIYGETESFQKLLSIQNDAKQLDPSE